MQKRRIKKSPIETLEIFKDEWIEKNVSGHECGNFDLQVDDFLVDSNDEINIEAIMQDHNYGKKDIDAQQASDRGFEVQEIEIDNKEQKPKCRNKVFSESDLATL